MVSVMNIGHRALTAWGMTFLELPDNARVLDCGCGGGANIRELLKNVLRGRSEESTIPQSVWKKHAGITPRRSEREAVRCGRAAWIELNSQMAALTRSRPLKPCISGLIRFPVSGRCTVS